VNNPVLQDICSTVSEPAQAAEWNGALANDQLVLTNPRFSGWCEIVSGDG